MELRDLSINKSEKSEKETKEELPQAVQDLLREYEDTFHLPFGLPPKRVVDH